MQHVLGAIEGEGVTGIGSALKAGYYIVGGGQHIDNLAFALIPPL